MRSSGRGGGYTVQTGMGVKEDLHLTADADGEPVEAVKAARAAPPGVPMRSP